MTRFVRLATLTLYTASVFRWAWAAGDSDADQRWLLACLPLAVAAGYVAPIAGGVLTVVGIACGVAAVVGLGHWNNELMVLGVTGLLIVSGGLVLLGGLLGFWWRQDQDDHAW